MRIRNSGALSALLMASVGVHVNSFIPSNGRAVARSTTKSRNIFEINGPVISKDTNAFMHERNIKSSTTSLSMAGDDFNEMKYTEAAWSLISSLSKVADFYQSSTIEAPILLDLMLNPSKHNAGDNAESAKKVVDKILTKAGVNVSELRSALETHLSTQARIADNSNKVMGRSLQKVLETCRVSQSILGVSLFFYLETVRLNLY